MSRNECGASWRERWKIPRGDLGSVIVVFTVYALFFLWLGLSVFGVEATAVKAAHSLMPQWFFFADMFFCPALAVFAAGPLPVPSILRVALSALMLASGSLFVVTPQHQAVGLAMLVFLYFEAYFIIPSWTRWAEGRRPQRTQSWLHREQQ